MSTGHIRPREPNAWAPLILTVRLTPALRAKLDRAAAQGKISLNKVILDRLERSFSRWDSIDVDDVETQITAVIGQLADHQQTLLERDLKETTTRDAAIREITFCISQLVSTLRAMKPHRREERVDQK